MKRKIKILVDAHIFDHSFQGTSSYLLGLYSALVQLENFEITLCAQNVPKLKELFSDERFSYRKLESNSRYKRLFFEYPRIIDEGGYDYAHFQYVVPFVKKCRFINTMHDLLFLDYKKYFSWKYRFSRALSFWYSAKRSDILLTVSDYSREKIADKFSIDSSKIYVTPNAVGQYEDSSIDISEKYGLDNYILYVSRFEPRKNQISLVEVFKDTKIHDKGYQLVFVGSKKQDIEKDYFDRLQHYIQRENIEGVHFFEGLSWPDLNAFYQQAECFAFPSLAEGFGIPPLEAAVNRCKVITSDKTAMADFDFFKYRIDPNDLIEFGEKLEEALNDIDYPFEAIKKKIEKQYNWSTIAEDFSRVVIKNFKNI